MTAKQVFESMLIECRKEGVPSLLLEDFNYYFNKAINNYINKRYNIYDVGQQQTDDIRVLKATAILEPEPAYSSNNGFEDYLAKSRLSSKFNLLANLQGATYEVNLPSDYLHLLNCICIYKVNKNYKCYDGGSIVQFAAKRLTADSWSTIINDFYNRPSYKLPYYYIHNVNTNLSNDGEYHVTASNVPTNSITIDEKGGSTGTDIETYYNVTKLASEAVGEGSETKYDLSDNAGSNFPRVITLGDNTTNGNSLAVSTVEKATAVRYGNASTARMEIRYGKDQSIFELVEVWVDYIKAPQFIRLTQEQMDLVEDTSQIMEFPDYVCQEIINELSMLVMARTGDPTLQSFLLMKETIANPVQQQAQQLAAAQ